MPRIDVSEDVLAAIRARRQDGKEPEDRILKRMLGLLGDTPQEDGPGFIDATYGIPFPEGFEISRTYKGHAYAARAVGGRWLLDADGRTYDSLNQLSQAVIDGNENAWMFWFFVGPDGTPRRIAELRDPAQVQKRPRRNAPRTRPGPLPQARGVLKPESSSAAPVPGAAAAPRARQTPTVRPAPPASSEPAVGGMAWEPAPKPKQG